MTNKYINPLLSFILLRLQWDAVTDGKFSIHFPAKRRLDVQLFPTQVPLSYLVPWIIWVAESFHFALHPVMWWNLLRWRNQLFTDEQSCWVCVFSLLYIEKRAGEQTEEARNKNKPEMNLTQRGWRDQLEEWMKEVCVSLQQECLRNAIIKSV